MAERDLTIWKFAINPLNCDAQSVLRIAMPQGAKLLHVAVQGPYDEPHLWVMCDPVQPRIKRKLAVYGTGHVVRLPADAPHVGTFIIKGGALVFHVFDLGESGNG